MQSRHIAPALLLTLLPALGHAQMSYTSIELNFIDIDLGNDFLDVDGDGFELYGSYALGENWFAFGQYQNQNLDFGADGSSLEVGAGYHLPLAENVDFVATGAIVDADVERGPVSADDQGIALRAAARAHLGRAFEVEGGLEYVNFDEADSDTAWVVRGRYYFTPRFAVTAGTDLSDHADTFRLGVRLEF